MRKIVVPIVLGEKEIWSVVHGLQLAGRVGGSVTVLEIDVSKKGLQQSADATSARQIAMRRFWAQQAKKKEVSYDYVQVKGKFCDEVYHYCNRHSYTTLVLEMSMIGKNTTPTAVLKMVDTLQSKNICKVELLMNPGKARFRRRE
jgi:hypothetical protein